MNEYSIIIQEVERFATVEEGGEGWLAIPDNPSLKPLVAKIIQPHCGIEAGEKGGGGYQEPENVSELKDIRHTSGEKRLFPQKPDY